MDMGIILNFNRHIVKITEKTKLKDGEKMTVERMLEIENMAKEVLVENECDLLEPIDIAAIVKNDNFDIEPVDMDINTTGYLLVDEKNGIRMIKVNTKFNNPDNEKDVVFKKSRFITAHEYGHYKLHKDRLGNKDSIVAHRDTDQRNAPDEQEADYFARSILMPRSQFEKFFDIARELTGTADVAGLLSRIFKVTKNKVNKRIEDIETLRGLDHG